MLRLSETNYAAVKNIDISNSNAEFIVKAILWVDGYPTEAFRMCNADGSVKVLDISSATIVNSDGTDGMEVSTGQGFQDIHPTLADLKYQIKFDTSAVGDFMWEQKEY